MSQRRWNIAIAIASLVVLVSLSTMAIRYAQTEVRKANSRNNLKSLVLGFHNYESAIKRLPSGCDIDRKHGWMTHLYNYMEASDWYSHINQKLSWDHPFNDHQFHTSIFWYVRPNESLLFTSEGYGVTHYLGNPSILHIGSQVKFKELDAGLSNVWFVGEIGSNVQPFGYPYNWRVLDWPLNRKDGGFGAWNDGVQFAMGDGAVRFVSSSGDKEVIEQIAKTAPLPAPQLFQVPTRSFRCIHKSSRPAILAFENEESREYPSKLGYSKSEVFFDSKGKSKAKVIVYRGGPGLQKLGIRLDTLISRYPDASVLEYWPAVDSKAAEAIAKLKNLEALETGLLEISEETKTALQSLPRLRYLSATMTEEVCAQWKSGLPNCEIIPR